MRLVWAALCDKAIVDGISRKLSLIDIPEILIVGESPHTNQLVAVRTNVTLAAAFWYGEKDNEPLIEARVSIIGPKRERHDLVTTEVGDKEKQKNSSSRLLVKLDTLPFWGPGSYEVELEVRGVGGKKAWKRAASYPFLIQFISEVASTSLEQPSEQTPAAPPASS